MTKTIRTWILAGALLCATGATAATEGPGRTQFLHAARTPEPIRVDGRLDEPVWNGAPAFSDFVQRFPVASGPPSERTEVRVLYDERTLYVGVFAHDSRPESINHNLGRRDSDPFSDSVRLFLDTTHEHRTAYSFVVNAGGVQSDGLYFDDNDYTEDWDGVWDAAARRTSDGWVAEFAIPLSLLRFPEAPVQTWGFSVRRTLARLNEEMETVDNPRTSNATVSRLGHLTGMVLTPRRSTQLLPYAAARAVARPQYSDPARPQPRLLDPSADVGLDFKTALTSGLALNGTFNPDFGQVEADQLILNLTTYEAFFPERRPFFTQGLELFSPVAGDENPQSLFYSRRVGLDTPILGAVKLTGTVAPGVDVGLLDAVVTGPSQIDPDEDRPDRRLGYHLSRPLHLGLRDELPSEPQVPMNYLAGVVRAQLNEESRVGGTATLATPLTGECTAEPLETDPASAACLARGGNAAALDLDLRSTSGEYRLLAQVDASQTAGGPPERLLVDGTVLRRGDIGFGGYMRAGRLGGEGLRWDVTASYSSPLLELNPSGFQPTQNRFDPVLGLRYQRPNGFGPLRALSMELTLGTQWTTDGRGLSRGSAIELYTTLTLPSFDIIGLDIGTNRGGFNVRELRFSGVPLENVSDEYVVLFGSTNPNRWATLAWIADVTRQERVGPVAPQWSGQLSLVSKLRPHPAVETQVSLVLDRTTTPPRFLERLDDTRFLLSPLVSDSLSLTLRQQWTITPRLTLQAYAQLFTAYGVYGATYEGTTDAARRPILFSSLEPVDASGSNDFHDVGLNVNVVVRWEYRLGSTLFLVYTHGHQRLPLAEGVRAPITLLPVGLPAGPATDALLIKSTWYWDV